MLTKNHLDPWQFVDIIRKMEQEVCYKPSKKTVFFKITLTALIFLMNTSALLFFYMLITKHFNLHQSIILGSILIFLPAAFSFYLFCDKKRKEVYLKRKIRRTAGKLRTVTDNPMLFLNELEKFLTKLRTENLDKQIQQIQPYAEALAIQQKIEGNIIMEIENKGNGKYAMILQTKTGLQRIPFHANKKNQLYKIQELEFTNQGILVK